MKKSVSVLLVLAMVLTAILGCGAGTKQASTQAEAAAPTAAPETGLPNPMTSYGSLQDMAAANPNIHMSEAPAGAGAIAYAAITGGEVSPVCQITFTLNGNEYTYRAAACGSEAAMKDIAGVYDQFTNTKQLTSEDGLTQGGAYKLEYDAGDTKGLATWYYAPTGCQYTLFTPTGCNLDQQIEEVVDALLPVPGYAPAPVVPEPPVTAGTVVGTVVSVGSNDLVINMANGNTLTFTLTHINDCGAKVGDTVTVTYSGDLADNPEAVTVTVTVAAPLTISGDLVQFDNATVYVLTASNMVYSFILTPSTKITGLANSLAAGDTITLTYTGDIMGADATATEINITQAVQAAPEKDPDSEVNKHLTGWVSSLHSKTFSIETSKGRTWTFHKDNTTRITGSYALEIGAKVTVTYDGYASDQPVATSVKVSAPPDPTPPEPSKHTVSGVIASYYGVFLNLTNGYGFNLSQASISGDTGASVGDNAKVTYYESDGILYATKVVFTYADYVVPYNVLGPGPAIGEGVTVGDGPAIGQGVTVDDGPAIGQGVIVE